PYDCVQHGRTGFKATTPAEFTQYVRLLVEDAALRRRIGQAAREEVVRNHGPEAGRRAWLAALEKART
ncbi:MAG TPA: glycosyltransferase, partial [Chloroflexota bacterium]|nr:glycosyltransferase [Chloroflexota bacterium]